MQIFRNGIIEVVKAEAGTINFKFVGEGIDYKFIHMLEKVLYIYKNKNIQPPVFISMSLIGFKGYRLTYSPINRLIENPIDRDYLHLPEARINRLDLKPEEMLQDSMNTLWNIFGYGASQNYDQNGNYIGTRQL